MNKLVLFTFLFTAFLASNAQLLTGADLGLGLNPWPQVAVDKVVQQVRDTPVSEELRPQLEQVVEDLQNGLAQCDELLSLTNVYWLYKRCVGVQLKRAQNAAAALEAASQATTTQVPA